MHRLRIVVLFLLVGLSVACSPTNSTRPTAANSGPIEATANQIVERWHLDNGLEVLLWPNRNAHSRSEASVNLIVHSGSLDETNEQLGYAHFVEHMLFNQPGKDVQKQLKQLGLHIGQHVNAYTAHDHTRYYLEISNTSEKRMQQATDLLAQFAYGSVFDSQEVAAEKGVVREEWRLRVPPKDSYIAITEEAALGDSFYGKRLPIGDLASIESSTAAGLQAFYDRHYQPENATLVIAGDFDVAPMKAYVNDVFAPWQGKGMRGNGKPDKTSYAQPQQRSGEVLIVEDSARPNYWVLLAMDLRGHPSGQSDDEATELSYQLMQRVLEQRLHRWAMEHGQGVRDVDLLDEYVAPLMGKFGVYWQANENQLQYGIEQVNKLVMELKVHGVSEQELDDWRRALLREEKSQRDGASHLANVATNHVVDGWWLRNQADYLTLIEDQVMAWSVEEANQSIAKLLSNDLNAEIVVGHAVSAPKASEVSQWLQNSTAQIVSEYVNSAANTQPKGEPHLAISAAAGEVIDRHNYENGVTVFTLSNGMQVRHKETDHKKQKVFMQLFGLGGWNTLSQADISVARLALPVLSSSGIRNVDGPTLKQWLEAEGLLFEGFYTYQYRGLDVHGGVDQLPVMLSLLHIGATEMKASADVLEYIKQQYRDEINTRRQLQYWPFLEDYEQNYLALEPAMQTMTVAQVDNTTVADVNRVYAEAFAGTQNYHLTVVGDISAAELKPLLEAYVANIPVNQGNGNVARPHPALTARYIKHAHGRPEQEANFDIYYYVDNQHLPGFDFTQGVMFARWLEQILTEEIREKHGLTYDLRVYLQNMAPADTTVGLNIVFDGDPARANDIVKQLHASLTDIANGKVSQPDLERLAANFRQGYESRDEQAKFLVHEISHAEFHGWHVEQVGRVYQRYRGPRAEEFAAWLKMFLNPQYHTYGEVVFKP